MILICFRRALDSSTTVKTGRVTLARQESRAHRFADSSARPLSLENDRETATGIFSLDRQSRPGISQARVQSPVSQQTNKKRTVTGMPATVNLLTLVARRLPTDRARRARDGRIAETEAASVAINRLSSSATGVVVARPQYVLALGGADTIGLFPASLTHKWHRRCCCRGGCDY